MSSHKLQAATRTLKGKQVKTLRAEGKVPATVYGKSIKPQDITVSTADFQAVYEKAGETGLIELIIGDKTHHVLIHTVQKDPVKNTLLHIEFHEVNLKEKVHADIPVELTGEPIAIKEKLGVLLPLLNHIEVEALPTDLPEHIQIDVSQLAAVNDQIIVGELSIPAEVTVLTDPTLIVVKIGAFVVEKEPEPVVTETAEPVAPAEGTPEGEQSSESQTKEETPKEK